jgi:hypothetical protein
MRNLMTYSLIIVFVIALGFCRSPYKVVSTQFTSSTVVLGLSYTGQEDYHVKPTNPIIKDLTFTLTTYTFNDFDIKITDVKKSRF